MGNPWFSAPPLFWTYPYCRTTLNGFCDTYDYSTVSRYMNTYQTISLDFLAGFLIELQTIMSSAPKSYSRKNGKMSNQFKPANKWHQMTTLMMMVMIMIMMMMRFICFFIVSLCVHLQDIMYSEIWPTSILWAKKGSGTANDQQLFHAFQWILQTLAMVPMVGQIRADRWGRSPKGKHVV